MIQGLVALGLTVPHDCIDLDDVPKLLALKAGIDQFHRDKANAKK